MNKAMLLAASAAVSLCAGGAAMAAPTTSTSGRPAAVPTVQHPGLTVLYNQDKDDSGNAIVSQKFEKEYATYDDQGADDFVVPAGKTWTIQEVDAYGQYFNGSGPATSENVFFYKAVGKTKLPGKQVNVAAKVKGKDNSGSFAITLSTPVTLTAGHYFVSVQANLAFSKGGEWGWEATLAGGKTFKDAAGWRNPQGGFGIGCTKWGVEDSCIDAGQGPDNLFKLLGTSN
jgi:hypothetical protein